MGVPLWPLLYNYECIVIKWGPPRPFTIVLLQVWGPLGAPYYCIVAESSELLLYCYFNSDSLSVHIAGYCPEGCQDCFPRSSHTLHSWIATLNSFQNI